jgi:hypothetical protein
MYISEEKRRTNIAEYLIYMFQVEDTIRSLELDIEKIEMLIIQKYDLSYSEKRDVREWYLSLIRHMKDNGLQKKGHCPFLNTLIKDLHILHEKLKSDPKENKYRQLASDAQPAIDDLRVKSKSPEKNDVEICLEGLYGLFLLKLSQKEITPGTANAFRQISEMLALLSVKFREVDDGMI